VAEHGVTLKPSATINADAAGVITEISETKTQAGGTRAGAENVEPGAKKRG
jgi:hypothetical protein